MKKGNDILFFEELMERAHFSMPASVHAKDEALKSDKPLLRKLLNETGQWSLTFWLFLGISGVIKKIRSAVLTNKILTTFVVIFLGIGAYYAVQYFTMQETVIDRQIKSLSTLSDTGRNETAMSVNIKNKIELHRITSSSIDENLLNLINNRIGKELADLKAGRIRQAEEYDKDIKYIIFGNVEDMGDSIQFYIKIIDRETSEVINAFSRIISKKGNIEQECIIISKDLSSYLK